MDLRSGQVSSVTRVACRPKDGPAGRRVGGGVSWDPAASRRQIGLEQGSRGLACQAGRLPGTQWQQTGPNTGAKMSLRQPGCERGLMTHWRVRLADWGQKAVSQRLSRTSGNWSQEQAGHLPREGGKDRRQLAGAARAKGACPEAVLFRLGQDLQGQGGKRLSSGARLCAG